MMTQVRANNSFKTLPAEWHHFPTAPQRVCTLCIWKPKHKVPFTASCPCRFACALLSAVCTRWMVHRVRQTQTADRKLTSWKEYLSRSSFDKRELFWISSSRCCRLQRIEQKVTQRWHRVFRILKGKKNPGIFWLTVVSGHLHFHCTAFSVFGTLKWMKQYWYGSPLHVSVLHLMWWFSVQSHPCKVTRLTSIWQGGTGYRINLQVTWASPRSWIETTTLTVYKESAVWHLEGCFAL